MKNAKNVVVLAYIAVIIRSFIYGLSVFFTGDLLDRTNVFDVLALRFLISAAFFTVLILLRVVKVDFKNKNLGLLALTMLFEPIGYFIFETYGILGTSTAVAGLLTSTAPIFTVIFEALILKETTTKLQKALILLRVAGGIIIILFATSDGINTAFGVIFMMCAVLSGVFFTIFSRKSSKQFTPIEITYAMTVFGAVIFNAINVSRHIAMGSLSSYFAPLLNVENLKGFIFLGIISSVIATLLNNFSFKHVQISATAALGGLSTLVTIASGVILNGEILYWYHYLSTGLILIASVGMMFAYNRKIKKQ